MQSAQPACRSAHGQTRPGRRCKSPRPAAAAAAATVVATASPRTPPSRSPALAQPPSCRSNGRPVIASLPATPIGILSSSGSRWPQRHCPVAAATISSGVGESASGPATGPSSGGGGGASSSSSGGGSDREGSMAPLRLAELPGKGRGVVATRWLSPGELLLVCRPLALVQGLPSAPAQKQPQPQGRPPTAAAVPPDGAPTRPSAAAVASAAGTAAAAAAAVCSEGALVSELQRRDWGPRQAQILAFLYGGGQQPAPTSRLGPNADGPAYAAMAAAAADAGGGGDGGVGGGGLSFDLADLTDPWDYRRVTATSAPPPPPPPAAAGAAVPQAAAATTTHGSAPGMAVEQLAAVVQLNATRLPSDDVLLARLYGKPNRPFIGLWPAHAMFNHSCAPNAVAVVSGSQLLVRCCSPVPPGGEVLITYPGALGLGPLTLRRSLVERNHRFRCTCARCVAEERLPRELAQLWGDIMLLTSQQLQPQLAAAAAALRGGSSGADAASSASSNGGSAAAAAAAALPSLLNIRGQVVKCCSLFEETLGRLAPSRQEEALWLQASMYPLYETRARCAQLLTNAASAAAAAAASATAAAAASAAATAAAAAAPAPPAAAGSAPEAPGAATAAAAPQQGREERAAPAAVQGRRKQGRGRQARGQQPQPQQPPRPQSDQGQEQPEAQGPKQPPRPLAPRELERALSEEYLDALSACLRLQGVASAGSDMHVQLAARYDAACAAHAARHPGPRAEQLAADARQQLERALSTRYGIPVAEAEALTAETAETETAAAVPSLASLLGVLSQLQQQQP